MLLFCNNFKLNSMLYMFAYSIITPSTPLMTLDREWVKRQLTDFVVRGSTLHWLSTACWSSLDQVGINGDQGYQLRLSIQIWLQVLLVCMIHCIIRLWALDFYYMNVDNGEAELSCIEIKGIIFKLRVSFCINLLVFQKKRPPFC